VARSYSWRRGLGLSPSPFFRRSNNTQTSNAICTDPFASTTTWPNGRRIVAKTLTVEEVAGSILGDTKTFDIDHIGKNQGATWQPVIGPRGTQSLANKLPRVDIRLVHMSEPYCHVTSPRQLPYLVTSPSVRPVSTAMSSPYDVDVILHVCC
jgi:hypothetical protein